MTTARQHQRAWMAWAAICVIWGTTYLAIKVGLTTIPPLMLGGLRYLLATAIMVPALRATRHRLPALAAWPSQAVMGFLMLSLGNGGVVLGERYLTSGLTAVFVGLSPFWMAGVDALFPGGARLRWHQWTGMAIGLAGIAMLVWPELSIGGASAHHLILGIVCVQVACLGWSIASSYTKRRVAAADVLGAAALQMLFGGAFMTIAGLLVGEGPQVSFTPHTLLALAYLTVFGSVIAFVAYSYALKHLPITVVSLYTYVNPVIAVALGILLLGEPFSMRQLAAALVIVVGMAIVRPSTRPQGDPA